MDKVIPLAGMLAGLVVILGNRPERRPGNLAPIQPISAIGAWALLFADAAAVTIAMRDGSVILLATALLTIAIALVSFVRDGMQTVAGGTAPDSVKAVIDHVQQLLRGAPRLGFEGVDAAVVTGRGPGIGVAVVRRGHVVVRVRHDIAEWLERHQQAGGNRAATIASFVRFTVFHELGHLLNGDHRTFRFVRGVVIAHLVWIFGILAAAGSWMLGEHASARPLIIGFSIAVMYVAQCLVARRFIAERERLADWRAMQTLPPRDAEQLLMRQGRRREKPNPTELEKLMVDLNALKQPQASGLGLLTPLVLLVWPEGDPIGVRAELASRNRAGRPPQPVLWSALAGMQCGFLAMTAALAAILAAGPWTGWRSAVAENSMLTAMCWIALPAATLCVMRTDPARMSLREISRMEWCGVVAVVFFLSFAAAALTLHRFYVRFGIASMPAAKAFAGMLFVVVLIGGLGAGVVGGAAGGDDSGGNLQEMPRGSWVQIFPAFIALMFVLIPMSAAASYWFGIGTFRSGEWPAIMLTAFAGFAISAGMARSTNRVLRAIAPMAPPESAGPVYGFRVFWYDLYVDLSRATLVRSAIVVLSTQVVSVLFFVVLSALALQRISRALRMQTAFAIFFLGSLALMLMGLAIPTRDAERKGASRRLASEDRLRLFEDLLAASRTANPRVAEELSAALAQWLRDDHLLRAVLPDARSISRLASLLSLVRLANATGERGVLERWRDSIERALWPLLANDAVAVAPGQAPSLYFTTLAAAIIDQARLAHVFPLDRMLDRIEQLLEQRLATGTSNLVADIVAAFRLLRAHGRSGPDAQKLRPFHSSYTLASPPLLRQSLTDLCELAELTGDTDLQERLAPIIRSRTWEVLQLNPRKDVLLLLDCYLAAVRLGQSDANQDAAAVTINEIAERASVDMKGIVKP